MAAPSTVMAGMPVTTSIRLLGGGELEQGCVLNLRAALPSSA
jgi:hypothetical protein